MYYQVVTQCAKTLKNVEKFLDRAEQLAKDKQFDVSVLLNSRLAPDQKGLIFQIQSACDYVKAAASWLGRQPLPQHPDTEQTIPELRERIRKTLAFVESVRPESYADADQAQVSFSFFPNQVIAGEPYLLEMIIPNVYFHVTMAYAILRHEGVDVGKMDYLQPLSFVPK